MEATILCNVTVFNFERKNPTYLDVVHSLDWCILLTKDFATFCILLLTNLTNLDLSGINDLKQSIQ